MYFVVRIPFKHSPRQWRVDGAEMYVMTSMLRMRPHKKLLQAELTKDTGKYMMLKDLHYIQTSNAKTRLPEMKKIPGKYEMTLPFLYNLSMV